MAQLLLLVLVLAFPPVRYDPVRLDAVSQTQALFSTPAPCRWGQDEPVIAVYIEESDDWYYADAVFVSGVDGCHYELEIKPETYQMCLAWPDTTIVDVWLQGFDTTSETYCWNRPTHALWLPSARLNF